MESETAGGLLEQFPTITSLLRQRITQVVVRLCTEHAGKCLFVVSVFTLGPCD